MFKKPTVKRTVEDIKSLRVYLRSVKKFGKSTVFRDLILEEYGNPEKGLLVGIGAEMGYGLLDGLNTTHINSWKELDALKKWLIQEKGKEHEIEIIAFDVIDELIPIVEKEVCRLSQIETGKPCKTINSAMGGYGKGQEKAKELMKNFFFDLYRSGFGIWAISHTKTKNIVEKGMEETEGYTVLTSNLSNAYEGVFGDIFDCVLTGMIDRDVVDGKTQSVSRKLYLRGTHYVDAGCRFAMGSVPEYISFDDENNAKLLIKTLKEGMRASKKTKIEAKEDLKLDSLSSESVTNNEGEESVSEETTTKKTQTELFAEIKPLYTQADTPKKIEVKNILKKYGQTKFDMTADVKMFEEVLEALR